MKVIYESIAQKVDRVITESIEEGKIIHSIIMTDIEYSKFRVEIRGLYPSIPRLPLEPARITYRGITIEVEYPFDSEDF